MQLLESPRSEPRAENGASWLSSPWAVIAATTLLFWVLSSIGLLVYTADARGATTHELLIPAGTGDLIESGGNPLQLPEQWSYYTGDELVIDNRDKVSHQIGPWFAPPGSVIAIPLQPDYGGSLTCSLHPTGEISLDVQPRGYDLRMTLFPTLLLGPILGLIVIGTRRVMRALDD